MIIKNGFALGLSKTTGMLYLVKMEPTPRVIYQGKDLREVRRLQGL